MWAVYLWERGGCFKPELYAIFPGPNAAINYSRPLNMILYQSEVVYFEHLAEIPMVLDLG